MGCSLTVACGCAVVNFFAIEFRKFAWILELPNCWKVTLTSPLISPAVLAAAPGALPLLLLLPQPASVAAAPRPAAVRMKSRLRTSLLRDGTGDRPHDGCRSEDSGRAPDEAGLATRRPSR